MRSFTNLDGELIELSDEHLDVAIKLKEELQKASPSRRTSWAQHKRMMVAEGFEDGENSEAYRCCIKAEQKSRGTLPEVEKHAEFVSDNKLQSLKDEIGNIYVAKRDNQNVLRDLNKLKRELADNTIFFGEIKEHVSRMDLSVLKAGNLGKLQNTGNALLVNASDWHIGLKTDDYNLDIAKSRITRYAEEIVHYATLFDVSDVYVESIGDMVEGAYLRSTQAYEIEFDYSTQVVKATEVLVHFLNTLSKHVNVTYLGGIMGNHSRMYDKGKNIETDSSENIIDAMVKSFVEIIGNNRIVVKDKKQDNSALSFQINGKNVKAVHGDLIGKGGDRITKFISSDNIQYDLLIYGHYHHSTLIEQNHGRLEIGTGCLQGVTAYSKKLGYDTVPSQTIIVFEGEKILPIRIVL